MTLTMTLPDGVEATLSELSCVLSDGRTGYYQRGQDCMRAALATLARLPYEAVPATVNADGSERTDEQRFGGSVMVADELADWANIVTWAWERGWRVRFHTSPPPRDWIAAAESSLDGFTHIVVCRGVDVVHDPRAGWELPPGYELDPLGPLRYGVSLEPIEEGN